MSVSVRHIYLVYHHALNTQKNSRPLTEPGRIFWAFLLVFYHISCSFLALAGRGKGSKGSWSRAFQYHNPFVIRSEAKQGRKGSGDETHSAWVAIDFFILLS